MDGLIILFKLQELSCLQLWYLSVDWIPRFHKNIPTQGNYETTIVWLHILRAGKADQYENLFDV